MSKERWEQMTLRQLEEKGRNNWTVTDQAEYDYLTQVQYALSWLQNSAKVKS